MDEPRTWGSDVRISMPAVVADGYEALVDCGGIGFGVGGVTFSLSQAEREAYLAPYFTPGATPHAP